MSVWDVGQGGKGRGHGPAADGQGALSGQAGRKGCRPLDRTLVQPLDIPGNLSPRCRRGRPGRRSAARPGRGHSRRIVTTVAAGTCDITAFQGGSAAYAAAQASGSFQVTAREVRSAQQIVFGPVPGTTVDVPIVLTASSQTLVTKGQDSATVLSGLAVSYTSQNRRVCTVSGGTVVPRAGGQCRQVAFGLPGIIPLGRGFALLPDHDHSAGAGDEISQASVA
jgi:hypothetical protein